MKKILLLSAIVVFLLGKVNAQCSPNSLFTALGLPGVYPPELAIPSVPIVGISDGIIGSPYSQTLTLVVLEDTTMNIGFLLPVAAVTAMNSAGMSTVMTVDVNHVTFDVQGLPNGISSQCDIASCQYPSATDGCIQLSGIPTVAGTFSVPVNMTINIQIPAITDPIFGTVIFPATPLDIPAFAAQTYDLFISDATSIKSIDFRSEIYPNPTTTDFTIEVNSPMNLIIYNNLGQRVFSEKIINNIKINKSEIGSGIFIVEISDNNSVEKHKLIIN